MGASTPSSANPVGGRKRQFALQRLEEVLVPVLKDPAPAAMAHRTGVKVHGWLLEQIQAELSCSTVVRYLHDLDFHLRVPHPWPLPLLDEPERETKHQSFQMATLAADPQVELWFGDECGVDGVGMKGCAVGCSKGESWPHGASGRGKCLSCLRLPEEMPDGGGWKLHAAI